MKGAVATAPRERGWRWFVLAIVAALIVSAAPVWPPALALFAGFVRLALPFEQFALLAFVSLAACSVVGWWAGGRFGVALLCVALAAWVLWKSPLPPDGVDGYGGFMRGWALVLSASFGIVCVIADRKPFVGRAVAAVALALIVWEGGMASSAAAAPPFSGSVRMLDDDYQRRLDESLAQWKGRTESGAWQAFAGRLPHLAARADAVSRRLEELDREPLARSNSWLVVLAPALLALESLAALALGWAAYHRLSRVRIGPPIGTLSELRFSDQLVWGLIVGGTLALLPTMAAWRMAGFNLLCFFGSLYALRGMGVLSWWLPERWAAVVLFVLIILLSLLGAGPVLLTFLVIALGVGLGDTWRDFRSAAQPR